MLSVILTAATLVVSTPGCMSAVRSLNPEGARVYDQLQEKKVFRFFLGKCRSPSSDIPTAVHEGVHVLTHERDAYPLLDGTFLRRPPGAAKLAPPGRILAGKFPASDMFVRTYLMPGGATSATDFTYLLDELNAYTHDLHSAMAVRRTEPASGVQHRDGLLALRSFVRKYAHLVPLDADTRRVTDRLLSEADRVIAASCGIPNFGKSC